jgi:hypothetical protein
MRRPTLLALTLLATPLLAQEPSVEGSSLIVDEIKGFRLGMALQEMREQRKEIEAQCERAAEEVRCTPPSRVVFTLAGVQGDLFLIFRPLPESKSEGEFRLGEIRFTASADQKHEFERALEAKYGPATYSTSDFASWSARNSSLLFSRRCGTRMLFCLTLTSSDQHLSGDYKRNTERKARAQDF